MLAPLLALSACAAPPARPSPASRVGAFPNSANPVTASPPLTPLGPLVASCALIENAALKSYNQLAQQVYHASECIPAGMPSDALQVVLTFHGRVKGVQFDRTGAVWLGDVALLRTTTPEPTPEGIEWTVQRDVTDYRALFLDDTPRNTTLSIPNIVDGTYNGVLYVNVSIALYQIESAAATQSRKIMSLAAPVSSKTGPWKPITAYGTDTVGAEVTLGVRNANEIFLDVFASGHGCEEFWYTNPPDGYANATGNCGGGAFRLIRVFVDGTLAGTLFPYPTVYTGGINPLLWRPLTGIESFDVVPYRFDLTPFAGLLNDAAPHRISVDVVGNNEKGYWYLDPVLVVGTDRSAGIVRGGIVSHTATPLSPASTSKNATGTVTFAVDLPRYELDIQYWIGAKSHLLGVKYELSSSNVNTFVGSAVQVTDGEMRCTVTSHTGSSASFYPYHVWLNMTQSKASFEIDATVAFARRRSEAGVMWENQIEGAATYNRSQTNHSDINIMRAHSAEVFLVNDTSSAPCFNTTLQAANGAYQTLSQGNMSRCKLPQNARFCGEELCLV
eukprot:TRINITY_DN4025_c0_g1_i4.p1 TRINITY_DN4025_c0_g1~~TRINITY_DN4025_c0_g1_i4.p1  ORF type:complete len:559 (+),score=118.82 TRINITY_DN4025_c0_g1_i4:44-1720(+)